MGFMDSVTGGGWKRFAGTGIGALTGGPIGGLLGYSMVDQPREAAKESQKASDAEQARVAAAIKQRNQNIAQLRALFGVGDGQDAQANQRTLAQAVGDYYQQLLRANMGEADRGFAGTSRTTRQNLARVGQLGSGLDAGAQTRTLSDYVKARQRAITGAASARDGLLSSLTSQRMGFENQLSNGTQANPDFGAMAAQRDLTLSQAQKNVIPMQLGQLFNAAGSTYFNGRVQEAEGNQGLQAFGFSGSGNSGRIS